MILLTVTHLAEHATLDIAVLSCSVVFPNHALMFPARRLESFEHLGESYNLARRRMKYSRCRALSVVLSMCCVLGELLLPSSAVQNNLLFSQLETRQITSNIQDNWSIRIEGHKGHVTTFQQQGVWAAEFFEAAGGGRGC